MHNSANCCISSQNGRSKQNVIEIWQFFLRRADKNHINFLFRKSQQEALKRNSKIEIIIGGSDCSITIKDNGIGLNTDVALDVLHNVGLSPKKRSSNRGFRGIGRFGGIGYCEELSFKTKVKFED